MITWEPGSARARFDRSVNAFTTVVGAIDVHQWDRRGPGERTVRDLVEHGRHAFTTIESCLLASGEKQGAPDLPDAIAYYRALAATRWDSVAAPRRPWGTPAAHGHGAPIAVAATVARVRDLVRASTDHVLVMTAAGTLRLRDYLDTRTFDITLQTLCLAQALGVPAPAVLADPVSAGLGLLAALGEDRPVEAETFLLLAGAANTAHGLAAA